MFNADPKILARLAPRLARVLIFDPQPAAAKLMGELLKDMGARHVTCASKTIKGLELIAHVDPQLVCMEYMGTEFDGPDLSRRLRRATQLEVRKVPIIMVSSEATVESIKTGRDAGVHEFLRKPYAARDLFRRVENVILNERMWIDAQMYVGPDRRRFNSGEFAGSRKRRADKAASAEDMLKAAAAG